MKTKSRRLKIVSIDEQQVLDWFRHAATQWKNKPRCLDLPMIDGLPADAVVHEVRQSPCRKTFDFLIESQSFGEVPDGSMIPDWEGIPGVRYETVELRTDADRWREQNHIKAYADHHSTADLDMRDRFGGECGDQTFIAGEDIKEHDVPCFVYRDGDKVYKMPRK